MGNSGKITKNQEKSIMFQGATSLSIDAKGRLMIPSRYRISLQGGGKESLVLTAHPHRCLLLYPIKSWDPIRSKLMTFSSFDKTASAYKRVLVGFAEELELDNSGRLLISPALRQFAKFEKQVMLIGQGSHFEIWSTFFTFRLKSVYHCGYKRNGVALFLT